MAHGSTVSSRPTHSTRKSLPHLYGGFLKQGVPKKTTMYYDPYSVIIKDPKTGPNTGSLFIETPISGKHVLLILIGSFLYDRLSRAQPDNATDRLFCYVTGSLNLVAVSLQQRFAGNLLWDCTAWLTAQSRSQHWTGSRRKTHPETPDSFKSKSCAGLVVQWCFLVRVSFQRFQKSGRSPHAHAACSCACRFLARQPTATTGICLSMSTTVVWMGSEAVVP